MKDKINETTKAVNSTSTSEKVSEDKKEDLQNDEETPKKQIEEIPLDVDEDLNEFLKQRDIKNNIAALRKAYRIKRLVADIPFGVFIIFLLLCIRCRNLWIIMGLIVLGYAICGYCYYKLRRRGNRKFSTASRDMINSVQEIFENDEFRDKEQYLYFILSQRIKERQRLDNQFEKIMKIISGILKLPLLLGVIVEGIIIVKAGTSIDSKMITYDLIVIAIIIIIGIVVDLFNYLTSDSYYLIHQTLLAGIKKSISKKA
ncbi:hypothetical protein H5S09_11215 [Limosilactobacillus sp. STM2_1]|uniref:Uncharacterized protein n=1 Tax=Limosilactobacillus rudii TaxID=2759755 RepID=A0A7W3YPL1_9LACO|nr:hypothetical protein [Limosilactobacillus rudii]MBB1080466.1 hypothetical protein [Limosilactobacillus rudii]MBB1098492.1 hypothetical protein [Limosilactobacillus rudii]MCD7135500.1 hypothetical protein [Limosilactobacillus rudii]